MIIFIVPKNSGLQLCKRLINNLTLNNIKTIEVRGEDVPIFVDKLISQGKKTIGITGEDLFTEFKLKTKTSLKILKKITWEDSNALFKKPALCLLGPKNFKLKKSIKIAINKKYPSISNKYLRQYENQGFRFDKIYLNGATEESYILGINDLVIDIVYSGKSAFEAELKIYDKIFESDIVVIGNKETLLNSPSLIKLLKKLK